MRTWWRLDYDITQTLGLGYVTVSLFSFCNLLHASCRKGPTFPSGYESNSLIPMSVNLQPSQPLNGCAANWTPRLYPRIALSLVADGIIISLVCKHLFRIVCWNIEMIQTPVLVFLFLAICTFKFKRIWTVRSMDQPCVLNIFNLIID